jgi:hypothetical protein
MSVWPTVFREGPFRVYFFSLEESRMHVHVATSDGEAKFWLEPEIGLARSYGLTEQDVNRARKIVVERQQRSEMRGADTSQVEVTNISRRGFWILVDDRELFLPFDEFPWFKDAPVAVILNVERPQPHHLHWPDLDVDLSIDSIDSIEHPERYPLRDRGRDAV